MTIYAPPAKSSISAPYPNPSNAVARIGFGALWDYVTSLLGVTGAPADAIAALGAVDTSTAQTVAGIKTLSARPICNGGVSLGSNGQLQFPAIQNASSDANTLDDYEEGTWTPGVGGSATYSAQAGNYVKIGRLVTVWFDFNINILGTGSTTNIVGLPFAGGGGTNGMGGAVTYWAGLAIPITSLTFRVDVGASSLQPTAGTSPSGTASLNPAIFQNGARVIGSVTYETNA